MSRPRTVFETFQLVLVVVGYGTLAVMGLLTAMLAVGIDEIPPFGLPTIWSGVPLLLIVLVAALANHERLRSFLGARIRPAADVLVLGVMVPWGLLCDAKEAREATVVIRDQRIRVSEGREGEADLVVTADSAAWLGFVSKQQSLAWAMLTRRIRLRGDAKLLSAFGRCFP